MSSLPSIEAFAADLLAGLDPTARKPLAQDIARLLRTSQQKRIAAQLNPDDSGFAPRKPQLRHRKGSLRRQMFAKLRTAKYLKARGTTDAAIVGFSADVSRIARVHQLGLRDRVNKRGVEADYPVRQLLGLTADDEALIRDLVTAYLAERL